jgi:hypothetical protein
VRPRSRSQFVRFAARTGGPRGNSVAGLVRGRRPSSSVVEHPCRRPSSTSVVENLCRGPPSCFVVENLCRGPPVRTSDSETNWLCRCPSKTSTRVPVQEASSFASRCEQALRVLEVSRCEQALRDLGVSRCERAVHAGNRSPVSSAFDARRDPSSTSSPRVSGRALELLRTAPRLRAGSKGDCRA